MRVFKGRTSIGVRGIKLAEGDKVISMAILRHVEATPEERAAYLKLRQRRARGERRRRRRPATDAEEAERRRSSSASSAMSRCRRAEQFVLTVSENGYGKRTSSYEYRITGRGGKGIVAMAVNKPQRPAGRVVPGRGDATRSCWSPTAAS